MESATSRSSIELGDRGSLRALSQEPGSPTLIQEGHNGGSRSLNLKPADGGIAAWRVLFAAFVFEALLWGLFIPLLAIWH